VGSNASDSYYDDGIPLAFDVEQRRLARIGNPPTGQDWMGLWRLRAANLDADPQDEFCITTSVLYTGRIVCYDGVSWLEQWHADIPDGLGFVSLAIADVDDDGNLDVVAGVQRAHTGAPGSYVYCLQGDTGWLKWRTVDVGPYWSDLAYLRVGEVDGDPTPEVLVANPQGSVFVVDGDTGDIEGGPWPLPVTALEIADLDDDEVDEVYVGLGNGTVARLSTVDGSTVTVLPSGGAAVESLVIADADGDEVNDFVYAAGGVVYAKTAAGSPIWNSEWLGLNAGAYDSLMVTDLDGDGAQDLVVNTGIGFAVFTAHGPKAIFADGFELGTMTPWSAHTF